MPFHLHHTHCAHAFETDHERFPTEVIDASRRHPILVDFWAAWCSPCHQLAPHLYRVVDDLAGAIRLAKVEVDAGENMRLAGHYRLRGFPTVILFQDGEERGRFSGSRASPQIHDWLLAHLNPALPRPRTA
ncbi:MAG: thioredoxin [Chromatiaceae bacterium]|nr:MAG: thioredoxin [Chromatiaceae bacterium]